MKRKDLDKLVKDLKEGRIGLIQEKSQYIKDLEEAYVKTLNNDSEEDLK